MASRLHLLLAAALLVGGPAGAADPGAVARSPRPGLADSSEPGASADTRRVAEWAMRTRDAAGLPFIIVDKIAARVSAFDGDGALLGTAPALLGLARGDVSPPGIGDRPLASITPAERITPAGRFLASHGNDLGAKDVVWVDYAAAISLHRVVTGKPAEARLSRLATPSILDNRISYGCINVPAAFYDQVIWPIFSASDGIVYILPETERVETLFLPANARKVAFGTPAF
jgi:hypothetical protein